MIYFTLITCLLDNVLILLEEIRCSWSRCLLQALEAAVAMDPLFVIARLDLARYHDHYGNVEKAEQLFKESLEVHPDSFDGHIHYGDFLFNKVYFSHVNTSPSLILSVLKKSQCKPTNINLSLFYTNRRFRIENIHSMC